MRMNVQAPPSAAEYAGTMESEVNGMAVQSKTVSGGSRKKTFRPGDGPVCVVLRDGRCYVGWIRDVRNGQLRLAGIEGRGGLPANGSSRRRPARISAFGFPGGMPGEAAAEGAGANPGPAGGLGRLTDWLGLIQKALPVVQMGMNMVKTIMPLLNTFKL